MRYNDMQTIGREALARSAVLGFDHLTITAKRQRLFGVRLAQSAVCRENVWRETTAFQVSSLWQGRRSGFDSEAVELQSLVDRIGQLRREIEGQSQDKETVIPRTPKGQFNWEISSAGLDDVYGPEVLYPLLEKHIKPVRDQGLRVTGYVEAQETLKTECADTGMELTTKDLGLTINITVDDEKTGAVGATQRATCGGSPEELDRLIGDAMRDATHICRTSHMHGDGHEIEPGDYTVVLHPSAVLDLMWTTVVYGFFDHRKIDEGRTYLSGKLGDLSFPDSLSLSQTLNMPLPSGESYCDSPFNHRLVPCSSLSLIGDGRVRDLHRSAFWAKKLGLPETFAATDAPPLLLEARAGGPLAGRHKTIEDLIRDTPRGVYVANTWYLRMVAEMDGIITGMTRDGIYEIKDGKLVRPIRHMRWHENPFRVLGAVSGLTDEKMLLGRSRLAGHSRAALALMPALRVENFHFSSVTKF